MATPSLTRLHISNNSDCWFVNLAALPHLACLRDLALSSCSVDSFGSIAACPTLELLELRGILIKGQSGYNVLRLLLPPLPSTVPPAVSRNKSGSGGVQPPLRAAAARCVRLAALQQVVFSYCKMAADAKEAARCTANSQLHIRMRELIAFCIERPLLRSLHLPTVFATDMERRRLNAHVPATITWLAPEPQPQVWRVAAVAASAHPIMNLLRTGANQALCVAFAHCMLA